MKWEHDGDMYTIKKDDGSVFAYVTKVGWQVEFVHHDCMDRRSRTLADAKTHINHVAEWERRVALEKELSK